MIRGPKVAPLANVAGRGGGEKKEMREEGE
jgi:hypothetical protein